MVLALASLTTLLGAAPAPAGIDVTAYELDLTPDFAGRTVSARETIRFTAAGAREVSFTDNALEITEATLDGRPAKVRRENGRIVFAADRPLGASILRLTYRGKPDRGLNFSGDFAWTSYFACSWMVCDQDRPGDKAEVRLTLRLPPGMTWVASSPHRPTSAYLIGFAAGRLKTVTDGRFTHVAPAASEADLTRLFGPTAAMAAFFERKAGVRLPAGRYTQVLVPGAEAQEASTLSVLGETTLAPMLTDPMEDWAFAHELAHQWWGNAVTCADWSEFWLNEGFATFMTAAWKEHRWGRAAYDREIELARKRWAAATEAGFDKPLAWAGTYPSLRVRRGIQYSKGAVFLDTLRRELGETAFWRGVRIYTRRHLDRTVTSRDLQRAMEEASGADLGGLFGQWVYSSPA